MKEGTVKFVKRVVTSKGKKYNTLFMYIPKAVSQDSAFDFKPGEKAKIIIDDKNKRLIIEKL